jgi:hypothetical protein
VWRDNGRVDAGRPSQQVSSAWVAYVVQLVVFTLLAMLGPVAYALSGDILLLSFGTLGGLPWSAPLWFCGSQTIPLPVEQALVIGCVALNVVLLAGLLRFAWVKTDQGAYTDARNGTWKVTALAGGALVLVALGSLGVVYSGSLNLVPALFGHPFLFGCVAVVMLPSAMYYLVPWRWISHMGLALGVCVSGLWAFLGMLVVALESGVD